MAGPLAGIRIVDLSQIVSGPFCTMVLADQGAEVIKVEPVGVADFQRYGPYRRGGVSGFFANANRGKRGLAVDLTTEAGKAIVVELASQADVFVQNFRPGVVQRLGLGPADLLELNPDLIYLSINGYGSSGPYADRPVFDPIIQGYTGHVAAQVNPEIPFPDLVRNAVADKATSLTAAQAVTAALFARERGQARGQHIELSLLDASLHFFWVDGMMGHTMLGDDVEMQTGRLSELYRLQPTEDGHVIYFVVSDEQHHALYRALGHPEWCNDPRFKDGAGRAEADHRLTLGGLIDAAFRTFPTEVLLPRLFEEGVPAGPVVALDELCDEPQVIHNGSVITWEHPTGGLLRQAAPPARFSVTPAEARLQVPGHGEHNDEILRELGYEDDHIAELRTNGIVL